MKNEKYVLSAFLKARPTNTELIFIGNQKNAYMEDMKQEWLKYQKTCPGCQVSFLTGLSDIEIWSAYKAADIFLCGSKTECFPIVILQAMAAGVPFISTRVGCVEELRGGEIADSLIHMAQKISEYLSNKDLRKSVGSEGKHAVQTSYTWPNIAIQYDNLFKRLRNS